MERVAIISDVHGNLTALEAVLKDIDSKGITKIYCLGDSVIKCARPKEVIDLLRDRCLVMLKGNCDEALCRPDAEARQFWSRTIIGEERAEFIYNCPVSTEFYMSGHLIRLFHASPNNLNDIFNPMYDNSGNVIYSDLVITDPKEMFKNTEFLGKTENDPIPDIVGYGHIHTPNIVRYGNKTIFNTGSVGIPVEMANIDENDPNNKFSTMASYAIIEGEMDSKELSSLNITLVRVPYDIEKEIELLEKSDMPRKESIIKQLKSAVN